MLAKYLSSIVVIVLPLVAFLYSTWLIRYEKYPDLPILPMLALIAFSVIGLTTVVGLGLYLIWNYSSKERNDNPYLPM